MINPSKLDFWIKNNYNVLLRGRAGTGKSTMVIDAFNRHGLKWKYFSASTLDPWVDFVGVPKEKNGVLELIRPPDFQNDQVEAIFVDEFNRGSKKLRNAILELIQFKSINGKKFNNLRIVWAAVNPEDDDDVKYDVEPLDPAQADRFHIQIDIPYEPHLPYFKSVYGEDAAVAAVEWWRGLPKDIQNKVSPRRLDYALDVYKNQGDLRDVLPSESNISKLITGLSFGSIGLRLKRLLKDNDIEEAKKFLSCENSYSAGIEEIAKKPQYIEFFVPLIDDEKVSSLMAEYDAVLDFVLNNSSKYGSLISDIVSANRNRKLVKTIRKKLHIGKTQNPRPDSLPPKDKWNCEVNLLHKKFVPKGQATSSYDDELTHNWMSSSSTTQARVAALMAVKDGIRCEISLEQAIKTLELLSIFIGRSYCSTLQRYKIELVGLINFCLNVIHLSRQDIRDVRQENLSISSAIDYGMRYPKSFYYNFVEKK